MESEQKILFYTTPQNEIRIEVRLEEETFWIHLKEVFKSGELEEESVIRKIRITAADGKKYLTNFYNLDAIQWKCPWGCTDRQDKAK